MPTCSSSLTVYYAPNSEIVPTGTNSKHPGTRSCARRFQLHTDLVPLRTVVLLNPPFSVSGSIPRWEPGCHFNKFPPHAHGVGNTGTR
eukprot:3303335-Rhodomonas_salina.1